MSPFTVAIDGEAVPGAVGLAMKALSTILGSQMLSDASAFVQSLDSTFGGFREKADRTYELLKRRGTQFVVVSAAEPDALREASFFVNRLSEENMPLAGLILNRTHPMLCSLPMERAIDGAETFESDGANPLTKAVLQIHADRAATSKREIRLLSRFTGANPHVAIVGVPSLPFVCAGDAGFGDEAVGPVRLRVKQLEEAGNRPVRLLRFRRHLASVTFSPNLVKSARRRTQPQLASITRVLNRSMVSVACATLSPGNPTCSQVTPSSASFSIPVK